MDHDPGRHGRERQAPLDQSFDLNTALVGAVRRACWGPDTDSVQKDLEIVGVLVETGADVNTMSIGQILDDKPGAGQGVIGLFESETLLSIAEGGQNDCPGVVTMLMEAGACRDLEGRRVEWGSDLDFDGIVKVLAAPSVFSPRENPECAASASSSDPPGPRSDARRSPSLDEAIFHNDSEQLREMVQQGADVNAANEVGEPPLQMAVSLGNVEMVRLLLEIGADVNAVDSWGETALHGAISLNDARMASLLIESGANVNAADTSGRTILQGARGTVDPEIIRLLEEAGAQ